MPSVHPRGRGEHTPGVAQGIRCYGSSPRARGTRDDALEDGAPIRFIPAGAGNTRVPRRGNQYCAVHPRGRGEHLSNLYMVAILIGSSPRARGTLGKQGCDPVRWRFIPAGAGNTKPLSSVDEVGPVHPRGRGEHLSTRASISDSVGSSPRARGTLRPWRRLPADQRFIPAGAGNTR